jgi:small-conductance mechanosensitive channel
VAERRFLDPSQPQTLQIATILLYIESVLLLLGGAGSLLFVAGQAGGAYGMANEKKWGYSLAVGIVAVRAAILLGALLKIYGATFLLGIGTSTVFEVIIVGALLGLLLHPQSREYQRIWFS